MPVDTSVKFLHSGMPGAPTMAGVVGAMVNVLDACLINGFGLVSVDSIVISNGVGTINRGAGMPFEALSVVLIAGATVTGGSINGERKIISTTATTATFDATGIANQTASGSITVKQAALGWTKVFSGTNLAAYKSSDLASTGCILRIADADTFYARARGYESMTDVNTGSGLFPNEGQVSGGLYWPKSSAADASARNWVLVGDGRIFYLMVAYSGTGQTNYGFNHVFGDIASVKSPDAYSCVIHGHGNTSYTTAGNNGISDFDDCNGNSTGWTYMPRSYTALGGSVSLRKTFPFISGGTSFKSGAGGLPYPNYADGGVYLSQFNLIENGTGVYRGAVPGFYGIPQNVGGGVFNNRDLITGVTGYSGKSFRMIGSAVGAFAFDVTGPWR